MRILTIEEGRKYARDMECTDAEMQAFVDSAERKVFAAIGAEVDPEDALVKWLAGQYVAELDGVHGTSVATANNRRLAVGDTVLQLQQIYQTSGGAL